MVARSFLASVDPPQPASSGEAAAAPALRGVALPSLAAIEALRARLETAVEGFKAVMRTIEGMDRAFRVRAEDARVLSERAPTDEHVAAARKHMRNYELWLVSRRKTMRLHYEGLVGLYRAVAREHWQIAQRYKELHFEAAARSEAAAAAALRGAGASHYRRGKAAAAASTEAWKMAAALAAEDDQAAASLSSLPNLPNLPNLPPPTLASLPS